MIKVNSEFIKRVKKELKKAQKADFCSNVYVNYNIQNSYSTMTITVYENGNSHRFHTEIECVGYAPMRININELQPSNAILLDFILSEEYGMECYYKNRKEFKFVDGIDCTYWEDVIIFYNPKRTKTARHSQICWYNGLCIERG